MTQGKTVRFGLGFYGWSLSVLLALGAGQAVHAGDGAVPDPLPAEEGKFRNTYYYMIYEEDYPANETRDQAVLDRDGTVLAKVSVRFRKDLLMEGSGKLRDGRVLNYHGKIDGVARFHETKHPYGRGAGNCALAPFKTIAVDPNQVPLGSQVYIDETRGMVLPDGTVHNGIWYAQDTGGAILHDRIDIYIGRKKDEMTLVRAGITHMEGLTLRIVSRPDASSCAHQSPE